MVSPYVIGGPTGSGKSAYALQLAQKIGGEIVCADSRQVYLGMHIGTASPTAHEKALVPHHNYNFVDPEQSYDAGRFIADTDRCIAEISGRGKIPILVGGTGLYLRCWRFGLSDVPQKHPPIREQLKLSLEKHGLAALYDELKRVDEESAVKIGANDEFRIIRALEIFRLTGQKASQLRHSHSAKPRCEAEWRLLNPSREGLNAKLLVRARLMFENGLVAEAIALRERLCAGHPLLETIGYKEALGLADGGFDLPQALEQTFIRTRQYAKRQAAWFAKEQWWNPVEIF